MPYFSEALVIVGGYLLGSVSFAVVVSHTLSLPDPRAQGSRNPGATNVARIGGRLPGALTLGGDIAKAVAPMLAARALGLAEVTVALAGFAAFLGHLHPLYHGFRGGKGVAVFVGVLAVMQWQVAVAWLAMWATTLLVFRFVSLASIVSCLAAPAVLWGLGEPAWLAWSFLAAAVWVVSRHASNIRNLVYRPEEEKL